MTLTCESLQITKEKELVGRQSPASEDVNTEAEEARTLTPLPGNNR
jgi:hypothetical protein